MPEPTISAPVPDYLGPAWRARTIFLTKDDGGAPAGRPDVAVLVHEEDLTAQLRGTDRGSGTVLGNEESATPPGTAPRGTVALWLPGFTDSFMQAHHAAVWRAYGVPLVGLDFRRGGRALRDPRYRDDIRDLYVREEEILAALAWLRKQGAEHIILIGHSTGGLQAALFAHRHPGMVDVVVLNSPWLDHNGPDFEKQQLTHLAMKIGKVTPRLVISRLGDRYPKSLHSEYGGEFDFNTVHKPVAPVAVFAGFFRAVRIAQADLAAGLNIQEPVLVAHSDASGDFRDPTPEELATTDVILNVEDMRRLGPTLGERVTMVEIPGGRHDLSMSQTPARMRYASESIEWALEQLNPHTVY